MITWLALCYAPVKALIVVQQYRGGPFELDEKFLEVVPDLMFVKNSPTFEHMKNLLINHHCKPKEQLMLIK
ncbi:hypothetical protein C5167_014280 [Papaver somniferum]|uniref:Uncharacterized protein n=1 Tax=Papaver somniferum TaxID=3469 RepID=A0A4Y7J710_PAPSO|nr:hypothetical protein C5167_014280 [Papaver somniferum]